MKKPSRRSPEEIARAEKFNRVMALADSIKGYVLRAYLCEAIEEEIAHEEEACNLFIEEFGRSPFAALSRSRETFERAASMELLHKLLNGLNIKSPSRPQRPERLPIDSDEWFARREKEYQEHLATYGRQMQWLCDNPRISFQEARGYIEGLLIMRAQSSPFSSTSMTSNLADACYVQALAQMLDGRGLLHRLFEKAAQHEARDLESRDEKA